MKNQLIVRALFFFILSYSFGQGKPTSTKTVFKDSVVDGKTVYYKESTDSSSIKNRLKDDEFVAGIDENNSRITVSNMVRNSPYEDCSIEEVTLYY